MIHSFDTAGWDSDEAMHEALKGGVVLPAGADLLPPLRYGSAGCSSGTAQEAMCSSCCSAAAVLFDGLFSDDRNAGFRHVKARCVRDRIDAD